MDIGHSRQSSEDQHRLNISSQQSTRSGHRTRINKRPIPAPWKAYAMTIGSASSRSPPAASMDTPAVTTGPVSTRGPLQPLWTLRQRLLNQYQLEAPSSLYEHYDCDHMTSISSRHPSSLHGHTAVTTGPASTRGPPPASMDTTTVTTGPASTRSPLQPP